MFTMVFGYLVGFIFAMRFCQNQDLDQAIFTAIFWPIFVTLKFIKHIVEVPGFLLSGAKKTWKDL